MRKLLAAMFVALLMVGCGASTILGIEGTLPNGTWDGTKWYNEHFEWTPPPGRNWQQGVSVPYPSTGYKGVYVVSDGPLYSPQLMLFADDFGGYGADWPVRNLEGWKMQVVYSEEYEAFTTSKGYLASVIIQGWFPPPTTHNMVWIYVIAHGDAPTGTSSVPRAAINLISSEPISLADAKKFTDGLIFKNETSGNGSSGNQLSPVELFLDFQSLEHDWRNSSWFGWCWMNQQSPWLYNQLLGWIYPSHNSGESVWFFSKDLWEENLWLWTTPNIYPWVYSHAESSWCYIKAGTDGKLLTWKQSDEKWYPRDVSGDMWRVLSQEGSEKNKAGDTFTIPDLSLGMLWVEPGTFTMGSPESEAYRQSNETQHEVTLTNGFWLGKHEVTQAQWEAVMTGNTDGLNATPSHFSGNPNRPVETVSWNDVQVFLNRLNAVEEAAGRLPAGMAYQLPTEAQWEYACRAGTKTIFSIGDSLTSTQANISGGERGKTTDVGKYPANAWGFQDMHGNVWEWCADWDGAYPTGAVSDPVGPADGSYRVRRGGSWYSSSDFARSALRWSYWPAFGFDSLGFRLSLRPASQ